MMLKVTPPTLTSTANVLSTMITPAVLIMACGSRLYAAVAFLVGTSVGLSLCIQLIFESRIALVGTYEETDYIRSINKDHAPKEEERESGWRMFR